MAFGFSGAISPVLSVLERFLPHDATVIDLGCGHGIWGHILKTYRPAVQVHGVEGDADNGKPWPDCLASPWTCSYHARRLDLMGNHPCSPFSAHDVSVEIEDLAVWLRRWPRIPRAQPGPIEPAYTLGLCMDVIEHLDRPDGELLLELAPSIAAHWFLTTPAVLFDADAPGYARHRCLWTAEEFRDRGWQTVTPRGATWQDWGYQMVLAYRGLWDLTQVPAIDVEK